MKIKKRYVETGRGEFWNVYFVSKGSSENVGT